MRTLGRRIDGGRRRLLGDGLLGVLLAAPLTYPRLTPPYSWHAGLLLVVGLLLLATAVVAAWRRPLPALVLVVLGSSVDGNFVFAIPVFSYLVGRRDARAAPAAVVFAVLAVGGSMLNLGLLGTRPRTWFLLATVLIFAGVFPWLVGRYLRQQHTLLLAGWEYAESVRREQRGAAERVRLRERARIARDMHDSLGHDLSLIALRAGALELAGDLDPRHRTAVGELRTSVTAATARLGEIVRVLRTDAGPSPLDPVDDVAALVAGARAAGMAVALRGDPTDGDLPALTGVALRGLVREALTNAARYAPGVPVTVAVHRDSGHVEVSVRNAAPPVPPPASVSAGTGLLALRERVRLAGGALDAGPRDGGFVVAARLPRTPTAAGTPEPATVPPVAGAVLPEPATVPPGGSAVLPERLGDVRRQVRRSLLVAVGVPVTLAGLLALVYHPFVTADAVLEPGAYERMRPGQQRTELTGLPRRQVEAPVDAPAGCEYYTDGNFPLAQPAYRLCFVRGRLVEKERMP
ncbi:sensor histidine kinase [Micromonospora sagamiensis]|uniref:histidine kinase n=1 Tax=Micromonospora sagamiensis TaxID=47875 RepID=A0A562WLU1_9ACTN|nr:histidine kinase [Micromonospora sagamiensis]TWJ30494.1 signal transduction histidine kinase [Micromonospora sagamiensis]BCL16475.1 two-component sensor histidine kinase [Micromonospora sagamiensis]